MTEINEIKMTKTEIKNYNIRKLKEAAAKDRLNFTAKYKNAESRYASNVHCNNLFNSTPELTSIYGRQQLKSPDKSRTDSFSDNTENEYKHRSEAGFIKGKPNDWLKDGLLIELQKFNSICKLAIENNRKYGIYTSVMNDGAIIVHDILGIYDDKSVMKILNETLYTPKNGYRFSHKENEMIKKNPLKYFRTEFLCKSNFNGYPRTDYKDIYFLPVYDDFIKPYVKIIKPSIKIVREFVVIENPLKK